MAVKRKKTWGYVYIVRSLERYKIGWTGDLRTLTNRLNRLHLMNAYGVECEFVIKSRRAWQIEKDLHQRFEKQRIHGEWFDLKPEQVTTVKWKYFRDAYALSELIST